ncbi:MAG TPA: hypothetical protein VF039_05815 [Longimicrobiales bacterium]
MQIEWFPYERAPLGRTRLRYVDLDAVLTDGKVERSSQAPGFVLLYYGGETEVIFVIGGEPVTAVRIADRDRSVIPLGAVKKRASAEREWADVAYFQAPEPQLRAMYATACGTPDMQTEVLNAARPAQIFTRARERDYSGVIEFAEKNHKVHYLVFMDGLPVHAFFADQRRASDMRANESMASRLERLFQPARVEGMLATGFPPCERMPGQAPLALVDVYRDLIADAIERTSGVTGRDTALRCFNDAFERLRERRPAMRSYRLAESGRLEGDSTAPVDELTECVASFLSDALTSAERAGAPAPADTLQHITRDSRLMLQSNGFFERIPAGPVG